MCPLQESVYVVLVAQMHQGVTSIREPYAASYELRDMDWEPVSIWKLETRTKHRRAVGASHKPHVLTQRLA